jgi:hypothetical protein
MMGSDSETVQVRLGVTINLDVDAWALNYDLRDEEEADDIRKLMPGAITEAIEDWIARTGNLGSVSVLEGKHADKRSDNSGQRTRYRVPRDCESSSQENGES